MVYVDWPVQNDDFPIRYVQLPESKPSRGAASLQWAPLPWPSAILAQVLRRAARSMSCDKANGSRWVWSWGNDGDMMVSYKREVAPKLSGKYNVNMGRKNLHSESVRWFSFYICLVLNLVRLIQPSKKQPIRGWNHEPILHVCMLCSHEGGQWWKILSAGGIVSHGASITIVTILTTNIYIYTFEAHAKNKLERALLFDAQRARSWSIATATLSALG